LVSSGNGGVLLIWLGPVDRTSVPTCVGQSGFLPRAGGHC